MSIRKAIDNKCKDCIYDDLAGGTWRRQTSACEDKECSLWEYRPLDTATKAQMKEDMLNKMSEIERQEYMKLAQEKADAFKERLHG